MLKLRDFETNPEKFGNGRENPFWKNEDEDDAKGILRDDEDAALAEAIKGNKELELYFFKFLTCTKLFKGTEFTEEKNAIEDISEALIEMCKVRGEL